jgi:hypothetical protein
VGYRLYVRLPRPPGEPIEGLYFVRSDCDRRLMTLAGNLLTDYNFHTAGIQVTEQPPVAHITIRSPEAAAQVAVDAAKRPRLPEHSAFTSLDEAAVFLKYKPAGIAVPQPGRASVVTITRDEAAWQSCLVEVVSADWQFFHGRTVRPEICYQVAPIAYQWNRARSYAADATRRAFRRTAPARRRREWDDAQFRCGALDGTCAGLSKGMKWNC